MAVQHGGHNDSYFLLIAQLCIILQIEPPVRSLSALALTSDIIGNSKRYWTSGPDVVKQPCFVKPLHLYTTNFTNKTGIFNNIHHMAEPTLQHHTRDSSHHEPSCA